MKVKPNPTELLEALSTFVMPVGQPLTTLFSAHRPYLFWYRPMNEKVSMNEAVCYEFYSFPFLTADAIHGAVWVHWIYFGN